jgi:hypothetical protein
MAKAVDTLAFARRALAQSRREFMPYYRRQELSRVVPVMKRTYDALARKAMMLGGCLSKTATHQLFKII